MRCSVAREAGTCANTSSFYIDQIERTVLRGINHALRHPGSLEVYVKEYQEEMALQSRDVGRRRAELTKCYVATSEALDRLVDVVALGAMPLDLVKAKNDALTAEREQLKTELDIAARAAPPNIALREEAVRHFQRTIGELASKSGPNASVEDDEVVNHSLRALIVSVTIQPGEPKKI